MKRLLSLLAVVFTLGLTTVSMDADAAKRMGSGKSMGTQRQATPDKAPANAAPSAAAAPAAPAMDDTMKAADTADDANVVETTDGTMFHTDTTKTEKVHLPAGNWTATPVDATQIQVVGASDQAMPDGVSHHVVEVKPLTKDVIAKVKFERTKERG